MMSFKAFLIATTVAAAATLSGAASAATILTFEGQANTVYNDPITRSGYVLGNVAGQEQHFHEIASTNFGLASNGTGVLMNDRDTEILLQSASGSSFVLSSFDIAASLNNLPGSTFSVTGLLNGVTVGTITGSLGSQFATIAGFSSAVDSVIFDGLGNGGGFELDNIALDVPLTGAAPEPSTWAMMGIGFGVMGFALRRKRKSSAEPATA